MSFFVKNVTFQKAAQLPASSKGTEYT